MMHTVPSAALTGLEVLPVTVEVAIRRGTPMIGIVGLSPSAAHACRERLRSAVAHLGLRVPGLRITVNLSPSDVRREGAWFDLPIAVAVLAACGHAPAGRSREWALVGELGLDGSVRGVRGALPLSLGCRTLPGIRGLIIPEENLEETRPVSGLHVLGARSLATVLEFLRGRSPLASLEGDHGPTARATAPATDLGDVAGQGAAKRALEIAAAGGHNVLFAGAPGAGKTLLARAMPGILPPLDAEEAIGATAVHSIAGLLAPGSGVLAERPFRAPHHTVSTVGLVGGGSPIRPGEISLAHHGVLFLDELPEFRTAALEALRQPLEEGEVRITRARSTVRYPASFLLVAAMNPCRCGRLADSEGACDCDPAEIRRYRGRISGPLLDRIDMHVDVPPVRWSALRKAREASESATVRERVCAARDVMRRRRPGQTAWLNARIPAGALRPHCRVDSSGERLLDAASRRYGLSARACHRILRVARTIADLAPSDTIRADHVAEAIQFRVAGRAL